MLCGDKVVYHSIMLGWFVCLNVIMATGDLYCLAMEQTLLGFYISTCLVGDKPEKQYFVHSLNCLGI